MLIKKFEKWLLNNITFVLFIFIIIILLFWLIPLFNYPTWSIFNTIFWINKLQSIISTQFMLTSIWTILAFWYWYKKYEETKQLNYIYSNLIMKEWKYDKESFDVDMTNFFLSLKLYEEWIIKEEIWNIIEANFEQKLIWYIFHVKWDIIFFVEKWINNKNYIINKLESIKKIIYTGWEIWKNIEIFVNHLKNIK